MQEEERTLINEKSWKCPYCGQENLKRPVEDLIININTLADTDENVKKIKECRCGALYCITPQVDKIAESILMSKLFNQDVYSISEEHYEKYKEKTQFEPKKVVVFEDIVTKKVSGAFYLLFAKKIDTK